MQVGPDYPTSLLNALQTYQAQAIHDCSVDTRKPAPCCCGQAESHCLGSARLQQEQPQRPLLWPTAHLCCGPEDLQEGMGVVSLSCLSHGAKVLKHIIKINHKNTAMTFD